MRPLRFERPHYKTRPKSLPVSGRGGWQAGSVGGQRGYENQRGADHWKKGVSRRETASVTLPAAADREAQVGRDCGPPPWGPVKRTGTPRAARNCLVSGIEYWP